MMTTNTYGAFIATRVVLSKGYRMKAHLGVIERFKLASEVAMELALFDESRRRPMSDEARVALVTSIAHEIGLQERHDELWAAHAPSADDIEAKGDARASA